MITIPASAVDAFNKSTANTQRPRGQRWGQAFHDYMKFDKVTNPQDRVFCDMLYNASDEIAKQMVRERTDHQN